MTKTIFRPDMLMCLVWIVFVAIYFSVPIDYSHAPGLTAWSLMVSGLLAFCFGSITVTLSGPGPALMRVDEDSLDTVIVICAIAGLAGAALIAIDKIFLSGQDWSIGLTALRERRAVEVVEGVPIKRSVLLYVGYLTVSFSCVSVSLFLLRGEKVGRVAGWLGQISVLAMMGYAVIYGGRMPILLVILLTAGCTLVRKMLGRSYVPQGWYLWPKVLAVAVAFIAYTNFVWARRREVNRVIDYETFLRVATERWDLKPSDWFDHAVRTGKISAAEGMDALSAAMYLTHSPTTVQRMVEHQHELSAYFGLYQIGILSPLFDEFAPVLKLPETMRDQLLKTGLYGWFPGAWAAWFMDGGWVLGLLLIVAWGALSGAAWVAVKRTGSAGAELMLAFVYTAILVSPLNGPFGMANSFLIFCSFAVVAFWLRKRRLAVYDRLGQIPVPPTP